MCNFREKNLALTLQTKSLKEVVAITKDLLGIRNMEVEHLQVDMKKMEGQINGEKERHNNMINKMGDVLKLNKSLKTEYETQLGLFQNLKGKYEEKVNILQTENIRLKKLAYPSLSTEEPSSSKEGDTETTSQSQERNFAQHESPVQKENILAAPVIVSKGEENNSTNLKEESQSQSDTTVTEVINKNEEGNIASTENCLKTVDIVTEDTHVSTQQEVNDADIVNTTTLTESGEKKKLL